MRYLRGAAVALVAASALLLPMSEASARCWWNGANWQCGPGLLALPFVAVAGAAAIVTAPVRAVTGAPLYGPGYGYAPGYGYPPPPPGYYYRQPPVNQSNN
jgi:hypothetical protein